MDANRAARLLVAKNGRRVTAARFRGHNRDSECPSLLLEAPPKQRLTLRHFLLLRVSLM